jgi:hypothetical protein
VVEQEPLAVRVRGQVARVDRDSGAEIRTVLAERGRNGVDAVADQGTVSAELDAEPVERPVRGCSAKSALQTIMV